MCGKESDIRVAGSKASNTCTNILILVAGTPAGTRPDGYTEFRQIRNRINSRSRIHAAFRDAGDACPASGNGMNVVVIQAAGMYQERVFYG